MSEHKFPRPDRSGYIPSPFEPDEDGVIDVGYKTGTFTDGREYRLECWRMDELVMATVLFSDIDMEDCNREELRAALERERIIKFTSVGHPLQCVRTFDDGGRSMWAVNTMLSNSEGKYCEIVGGINNYGQILWRGDYFA